MGNLSEKLQKNQQKTFPIVWLDKLVNQNQPNINAQKQLRTDFYDLTVFDDENSCEHYLQTVSSTKSIVFIVSGRLGESFVPKIHQLTQISTIYIFCMNDDKHKIWAREFYKIRGVMTSLKDLIECIQSDHCQQKHASLREPFSFSICQISSDLIDWFRTPNDEFLYGYVLFKSILQLDVVNQSKSHLTLNSTDAKLINEFKEHYSSNKAIWWLTRCTNISKLLEKALHHRDIDRLILLRFWLHDIELQLNQTRLHTSVRVYHSLRLHRDQFNRLQNAQNQFLMIHSFLCTHSDRNLSLWLLDKIPSSIDTESILIQIDADSSLPGIAGFSQVQNINFLSQEEIIFSLNSIFQIVHLDQDENHVWTLQLVLCGPEDIQIDRIFHYFNNQYHESDSSPLLFGILLSNLNQHQETIHYYHRLIEVSPMKKYEDNKIQKLLISQREEQQSCQQLLSTIKSPLKLNEIPKEPEQLVYEARQYERVAKYYFENNNVEDAINTYELSIVQWKTILDDTHPQLGLCWYQIASIYDIKQEFSTALKYYQIALDILEKNVSDNRNLIHNIGNRIIDIYRSIDDFQSALDFNKRLQSFH